MKKFVINEEFLMFPGEEIIPMSKRLGQFIMGLRQINKKPAWTLKDYILVLFILVAPLVALTTTSIIVQVAATSIGLICFIMLTLYKTIYYIEYFMNHDHILFYENGFIWERRKYNGNLIDSTEIGYADVEHIEVKEKSIQGGDSRNYIIILYSLSLIGHNGKILFSKSSKYYQRDFVTPNPKNEHILNSAAMKTIQHYISLRY